MEERAENAARWMTDFQADHPSARTHHAQHLTKALANIGQVADGKSGAAAIHAVVRQVDMLSITRTQFDAVLQAETLNFFPPNRQHFRRNIHADHARSDRKSTRLNSS